MIDRQHVSRAILPLVLATCLLVGLMSSQSFAKDESPCDPGLPHLKDSLSYQLRGDRCEGLYAMNSLLRNLSGTLRLISFTESFETYSLESGQDLQVEWKLPKAKTIFLRADTVRADMHYRMDARPPAESTRYHWPIDVLQSLSISRNELGVMAWANYTFSNGMVKDVYLPLRISQEGTAERTSHYQLVIWPLQELEEVFVSVAKLDSDGAPQNFILDGKELGYGYYPKERGVYFEIPKPEHPGYYYLQIGASFGKGAVVDIEYWFYHAE